MIPNDPRGNPAPNPSHFGDMPRGQFQSGLLTGRDAAAHINQRLASRQWWLFVTCDERGAGFLAHLEAMFYSGEGNMDFEVVVLPALNEGFGVVAMFLARKSRMSADQLHREMVERVGPISVEELRTRDVLFPHPDVKLAGALAEFVVDFLKRRPRPEDN
jgi:hypothetical protein